MAGPRISRLAGALTAAALALALIPAAASANHDHRKVYVFVLDGVDGDALSEGAAPFISGLIDGEGGRTTYFPRSRSMMIAETNPNHTSMITGAYPKRTGITGNEFAVYGETPDEDSCQKGGLDNSRPPTATSGESTGCVRVPNLFETVERHRQAKHITTALIMGKPKLARLFATRRVRDSRYDADHVWSPCDDDEPYCEDVPTNPVTGYAASDSIVMDEVLRTVNEGVIDRGRLRRPDFTFANFPQVDSAGHATGRSSAAYDAALLAADLEIQRFVENQKKLGIWKRTVLMIVSDHSMDDTPQLDKVSVRDALQAGGIPESAYTVVGNGSAAHVYLNNRRDPGRHELLMRMRRTLSGVPGIDEALYRRKNPLDGRRRHTMARRHPDWGLGGHRSGDIVVTTRPGIGVLDTSEANSFPFNPLPGNHGGPQTRDNTFLITGGNRAIRQRTSRAVALNADVNPTAMKLLNRPTAKSVQGRYLRQAFIRKKLGKAGRKRR